ncbi:MAG: hypothetical protein QNK20_16430 [Aureibaculum sp.]|nr:hypothetical protein [Aureibaculum sp.]
MEGKIISIKVNQLAYNKTENSIISIHCFGGKKYTNNVSLDELYICLDRSTFLGQIRQ